jgi:hypothetical protein
MATKKVSNQKTLVPPSSLPAFENLYDVESETPARSQRIDNGMVKKLEDESKGNCEKPAAAVSLN